MSQNMYNPSMFPLPNITFGISMYSGVHYRQKKECTSPAHPRCCLVSNYEGTCWTAYRQQEQRGEKFSTRGRVSFPGNLNHRVRGLLFTVWDYDRLPAALEFRFCYAVITTNLLIRLRFDGRSTAYQRSLRSQSRNPLAACLPGAAAPGTVLDPFVL